LPSWKTNPDRARTHQSDRARAGLRNLRCVQDYSIEDTDHSDVQPNCFAMQSEQLTINSEGLK